jgi:hypothetical protein
VISVKEYVCFGESLELFCVADEPRELRRIEYKLIEKRDREIVE